MYNPRMMMQNIHKRTWPLFLLLIWLLTGCAPAAADALPYVDLQARTPLPTVQPGAAPPLHLGVAAIVSPAGTVDSYAELAQYLGEQLGRSVELVQRRTYAEINEMVAHDQVDLAFVCTNAYVVGNAEFGMELLLAPEINGVSVYHAQVIVPANSTAQSLADLRGKTFAFTDPMSFTGRIYPHYLVQQLGATPETFFDNISYTYSHDHAIEAVAAGVADGASVDSLVLDYALQRDPALRRKIRIIHTSQAFGIPPVVVPSDLPMRQKARISNILATMHESPAGRNVLAKLGIDRFVPANDTVYDGVRRIVKATGITQ